MVQNLLISLVLTGFVFCSQATALHSIFQQVQDKDLRQEESTDYFDKWLKEDVVYIITSDEKEIFQSLSSPEEKERFIEQFWFRRDTDPGTVRNEFKEEHYRRIAYANDIYQSGWPGWRTDRGRIYIIHGPPAEIEFHPAGERYERPMYEGGGTTSTHAYITWRYRNIDGVGNDVVLEFVDDSFSGEYRLAISAQEKDALLHIAEQGLTLVEQMGGSKDDQSFLGEESGGLTYGMIPDKETAFGRYATYTGVLRPPDMKYRDLERFISVDISYQQLPIALQTSYFRVDASQSLIPITISVDNKDLTFVAENDRHFAGIILYGIVTNLSNRIMAEFEHELTTSLSSNEFQQGLLGSALYQKTLLLKSGSRYKINLIAKDINGDKTGVIQSALIPTLLKPDVLSVSSVILSDSVKKLGEIPSREEMFALGDVWIVPNIENKFKRGSKLTVYFQIYSAHVDQTTLRPKVNVQYTISAGDGREMVLVNDPLGESIYSFSNERIILMRNFSLDNFSPGKYSLTAVVRDEIGDQSISIKSNLEVTE